MKKIAIGFTMCAACAFAQFGRYGGNGRESSVQANIRGGGSADSGKCTVEVEVDGTAEVFVSGTTARVRTLGGQPAVARRMDCTSPMPTNAAEYRFTGVDGRGSQNLVRDPRSSGGAAVVRIDDPKGGREGYTFDIEWRGANGTWGNYGAYGNNPYGNNGAYGNNGRYGNNGQYGNNGRYGNDPYGGRSSRRDDGYYGNNNTGGVYGSNGNYGGWNNGWGNEIRYRGNGRGQLVASGRSFGINRSDVYVDRNTGQVTVELDTDYQRDALRFAGQIQRVEGNTILADVRSTQGQFGNSGANGVMRITIRNNNRVDAIAMDGNGPGGRFRLNWSE